MSQQTLDAPASWRRELVDDPAGFVAARPHLILIPAVFVVFVALWEWVVRRFDVPAFIAPAPSAVLASLAGGVRNRLYLEHFGVTLYETLLGFLIASVAGTLVGFALIGFWGGSRKSKIPLGTFLGLAGIVVAFVGEPVTAWYRGFLHG